MSDGTYPTPPTTNAGPQGLPQQGVGTVGDAATLNRYMDLMENMTSMRQGFLQQMLDPRRDIDQECGYPGSMTGSGFGSINPDLFRLLYEREPIATKVVQLMPKACWQKSPMVFEDEDPENITPFEEDWDTLGQQLRGEQCFYQDEEGSPIWNLCYRADVLSGIGSFGIILLGIDDGKNLDQPLDGVASYDPTGNMVTMTEYDWKSQAIKKLVANEKGGFEEKVVGFKREYQGKRVKVYPTSPRALPSPLCNEIEQDTYPTYKSDSKTGLPVFASREKYPEPDHIITNELPARFQETSMESAQDGTRPNFTGPKKSTGESVLSSGQLGTDAQYVGVQLTQTEYPATKPSSERRKLMFAKVFDETLVQIVQYEANVRNPRFGQPVMYRVTLNDPREQHSGIGLPMATVRVHWSRVIHICDNNGSSDIFGVPRQRPVLNRLLDIRKIMAASAEGYWQNCFARLVLSTHPQLGGDVKVNVPQLTNMLENVRNGMQREMILMGMGASTVSGTVQDPTPFIAGHLEAICVQLDCPVRVFKGSERGELASSQDDDEWLDHVRFRQYNQCSTKIVVPLSDRLIACGVLRAPGSKKPGKKVPAGVGHKGAKKAQKEEAPPLNGTPPEEEAVIGNRWSKGLLRNSAFQNGELESVLTKIKDTVSSLNDGLGYGQAWFNPRTQEVWVSVGDWDEDPERYTTALRKIEGVKSVRIEAESSPSKRQRLRDEQWLLCNSNPEGHNQYTLRSGEHGKGLMDGPMDRESADVLDQMKVFEPRVYYHGTSSHLESSIASQGLKPDMKSITQDGFSEDAIAEYKQHVYLSKSMSEGSTYAELEAGDAKANPMLLRITVPRGEMSKVTRDPELSNRTAVRFKGAIPPEWIERVPHLPERVDNFGGGPPPPPTPPKPPKVTVPDTGKPAGYSVHWPDLDSLGDKDKAAIALQVVQAMQAYVAGGCEAICPVFEFFVHVLQWDEELVTPMLQKVMSQAEPTVSIPAPGELGHPATPEPEPEPIMIGAEDGQVEGSTAGSSKASGPNGPDSGE